MSGFFHIVAVLASDPDHPQGDPAQVLTLHAPLTTDAQLDATRIAGLGEQVSVELAIAGTILWSSRLVCVDGGWAVRPESGEEGPLWRLDVRALHPGEYMTLYPEIQREQVYRIVNMEPG